MRWGAGCGVSGPGGRTEAPRHGHVLLAHEHAEEHCEHGDAGLQAGGEGDAGELEAKDV